MLRVLPEHELTQPLPKLRDATLGKGRTKLEEKTGDAQAGEVCNGVSWSEQLTTRRCKESADAKSLWDDGTFSPRAQTLRAGETVKAADEELFLAHCRPKPRLERFATKSPRSFPESTLVSDTTVCNS